MQIPFSLRSNGMLKVSTTHWETFVGNFGSSPKGNLEHHVNAYIVISLELD